MVPNPVKSTVVPPVVEFYPVPGRPLFPSPTHSLANTTVVPCGHPHPAKEKATDTEKAQERFRKSPANCRTRRTSPYATHRRTFKGKARELGCKVQKLYADAATVVRDEATENSLGTLVLSAVASFLIGVLWSNSGSNPAPKECPRES